MATFLLAVIYLAFIGLGLPDSLFGTAWPAIYADFNLPISFGSFVTVIISCGTVISSLISSGLIKKFGTNVVSAASTLLTAAALLGFSVSPNIWCMCILAIPLGIGAGAIDVALNNYVALHYSATHMSFLHCFYGVGVTVSPYILSRVISGNAGWRGGYKITFFIQLAIALVLFFSLPVWKKVNGEEKAEEGGDKKTLSFYEVLKIPGVGLMCSLFIISCAIECTCGGWGSTFLVEYKNMLPENAAKIIMIYYLGITLGRFVSGLVASFLNSWKIVNIGTVVMGVGILILLLPVSAEVCGVGLFLIGFGNGPLFPNFNFLAPISFGSENSQSVIGVQMASAYVGIMLAPMLCGILGQSFGMVIFPFYLLVFFAIAVPCLAAAQKLLRKK